MDLKEFAKQLRKPEGEAGIGVGKNMNEGNARLYELVYSLMDIGNNERILELGFGNGKFIPDLLNKGNNLFYAGIDFSETMVKEALLYNHALLQAGSAQIREGNISAIPYENGSFDKVFTINTLYFWPSPLENMKEVGRVLKTGGYAYLGIRPKSVMNKIPFVQHGFELYEPEDAKALMEAAGFTDVTYEVRDEPPLSIQGIEIPIQGACIMGTKK